VTVPDTVDLTRYPTERDVLRLVVALKNLAAKSREVAKAAGTPKPEPRDVPRLAS
jgi:hypothetical protein